jgi:hypothetical protein
MLEAFIGLICVSVDLHFFLSPQQHQALSDLIPLVLILKHISHSLTQFPLSLWDSIKCHGYRNRHPRP